jgi:hypothetical protein
MQVSQDCVWLFRANMETMLVVAIIIAIIATGLGAKIHIQECGVWHKIMHLERAVTTCCSDTLS